MKMLGHNQGPTLEPGYAWRKHSWAKARADLLPTLPIEILRTRVKRAKALGLPYKTYASVRAASGRDVVGFLFSNNALRVLKDGAAMPEARAARLRPLAAELAGLVHPPLSPEQLAERLRSQGIALVGCERAPHFSEGWSDMRQAVMAPLRAAKLPRDGVLVIGDTGFERNWSEAAKLAGFIHSDHFFPAG